MSAPTILPVGGLPKLSGQYTGYAGSVKSESTAVNYPWASGSYTGALAADFTGIVGTGDTFQRFTSTTNAAFIALSTGFVQKVVAITSSGTALFGFSVMPSAAVTHRNAAYIHTHYDLKLWDANGITAVNRSVFTTAGAIGTLAKTGSINLVVNHRHPLRIIWNSSATAMTFTREVGYLYTDTNLDTFAGSTLISGQVVLELREYRNGKTNQYYLQN